MLDKEVGELYLDWLQVHRHNSIEPIDELELKISTGVLALIHKLVMERENNLFVTCPTTPNYAVHIATLGMFGLDAEIVEEAQMKKLIKTADELAGEMLSNGSQDGARFARLLREYGKQVREEDAQRADAATGAGRHEIAQEIRGLKLP